MDLDLAMRELRGRINSIAAKDVDVLCEKEEAYGDSWKKRGGTQAFAVIARKWDRIENIADTHHNYDIFDAMTMNTGDIMDDIRDLRRYLFLLEDHLYEYTIDTSEPQAHGYVGS